MVLHWGGGGGVAFFLALPSSLHFPTLRTSGTPGGPKTNMYATSNMTKTPGWGEPQSEMEEQGRQSWPGVAFRDPRAVGLNLTSEMRPGEHQGPQRPLPTYLAPSQQDIRNAFCRSRYSQAYSKAEGPHVPLEAECLSWYETVTRVALIMMGGSQ